MLIIIYYQYSNFQIIILGNLSYKKYLKTLFEKEQFAFHLFSISNKSVYYATIISKDFYSNNIRYLYNFYPNI